MSIKPILFNTDMVRAILDGRKTVTRRVLAEKAVLDKNWGLDREPYLHNGKWYYDDQTAVDDSRTIELKPKYQPGDILYVRETWQEVFETEYMDFDSGREVKNIHDLITNFDEIDKKECGISGNWAPVGVNKRMKYIVYKADDIQYSDEKYELCWHPSIHMPKEAARIWLKVTNVRVERLQNITMEQCVKEGLIDNRGFIHSMGNEYDDLRSPKLKFQSLWDSTVKKDDLNRYGWEANPWVWAILFERCEKPQEENNNG